MTAGDLLRLTRLHTAGYEVLVFCIGPQLAGVRLKFADYVELGAIGALITIYIFVLNDLTDLARDREDPARQSSPLVAGRVSEQVALYLSVAAPLGSVLLIELVDWNRWPASLFVAVLIVAAFVNIYQKRTEHPIVMDALFAATMAAPIPTTAWQYTGSVSPSMWFATIAMFLLSLELNSIAGNLKGLEADSSVGFRTVAILLGARSEEGTLCAGPRYERYVWTLHGLTTVALILLPLAISTELAGFAVASLTAGVMFLSCIDVRRLLTGRRLPSRNGREPWFAAGFIALLFPLTLTADVTSLLGMFGVVASWEAVFRVPRLARRSDATAG